jgi:integrase
MTCAEELGSAVDDGRGSLLRRSAEPWGRQMKKRGNGEGTIVRRRDGRWCAIATLPEGRRKCMYARTRSEAVSKLRAAVAAIDRGSPMPREQLALEAYLGEWLEAKRAQLRTRTWKRYESMIRVHTIPRIGRVRLVRLEARHLEALYSDCLQAGSSPSSVHHLHTMLHGALDHALRRGLVVRNVADLVDPPAIADHEMLFLTPDEVQVFLNAAEGEPHAALYVLAATTGMRQGELLGLHWRQVDLQQGAVSVVVSLEQAGLSPIFSQPKTRRSRRRVMLCARAIEALRRHKALQAKQLLEAGSTWRDLDLVFTNATGGPINPQNLLYRHFHGMVQRGGLPPIRFHDLRHTAATTLLVQGVNPKVVSEMLGHASVAFTLQTYCHAVEGMQRDAVRALDDLFGGTAPEPPGGSRATFAAHPRLHDAFGDQSQRQRLVEN